MKRSSIKIQKNNSKNLYDTIKALCQVLETLFKTYNSEIENFVMNRSM